MSGTYTASIDDMQAWARAVATSDWTLWRRYCKRHNPAAFGRAPLSPAARPTRVAHLFSVGGEAGWRYYAFESREQLYAFLAGVPGAMEVSGYERG